MTPRQLEILQHALGANKYGRWDHKPDSGIPIPPRNHFCAGANDEPTCRELVEMGYMKQHRTTATFPDFNCSVTDKGRAAMHRESLAPPKVSRSKKRYLEFLDEDCGYSFGEWLKDQKRRRYA